MDITLHSMLVHTKRARGESGEHMFTLDIDKQIGVRNKFNKILLITNISLLFNFTFGKKYTIILMMLRKGVTPDLCKNYQRAIELVAKTKKDTT